MAYDLDAIFSPLMDFDQMVVMLSLWKNAHEISSQLHDGLTHVLGWSHSVLWFLLDGLLLTWNDEQAYVLWVLIDEKIWY